MEVPVIATNWSGQTDYMNERNSYPLPIEGLIPANTIWAEAREDPRQKRERLHHWAQPSLEALKRLLEHVRAHPAEAKARARVARQDMVRDYAFPVIAERVRARLDSIGPRLAERGCDLAGL